MTAKTPATSEAVAAPAAADVTAEVPAEAPERRTVKFRKRFTGPRPLPGVLERQSEAARLAWSKVGADAAPLFLNTHHDGLGGRPVDVAGESDEGLVAVRAAIAQLSAR
jgi:hypothetical protein